MQRLIRSRTGWLAIALLVVAAFVLRLFQLQILQYGKYTGVGASRSSVNLSFLQSAGKFTWWTVKRQFLWCNQAVYTVIADPQSIDDK